MLEGVQYPAQDSSEDVTSPEDQGRGMCSSSRRGHLYKRRESPERNTENKMICTRSVKCSHLTFNRKCDWSRHMDKHDRPYKCKYPSCKYMRGFTYNGGLTRHLREVHKLYSGIKQSLFCPYKECKRSYSQEFARKENLHEHIRRMHRNVSGSSDRAKAEGEVPGALITNPAQVDEEISEGEKTGQKRRRLTGESSGQETDPSDLRAEIKRLRIQNKEKDQKLWTLETAVREL